jgi:hypothetical protein
MTTTVMTVDNKPVTKINTTPQKTSQFKFKRIIWVTGGKGGVGKSTVSRGLYDLLHSRNISISAFDGDRDNSQLYRYYKDVGTGVKRIDIEDLGDADLLVHAMDKVKPDVLLVDVAAGGSKSLLNIEADQRILSDAAELGYKFTIVSVMSRIKDSVNLLKATIDSTAAYDVDHIAFKNLYFGSADRFRLFDGSSTKTKLLASGGSVLDVPEMYDDTYEILDDKNLPFTLAIAEESGLARSHRNRIRQWLGLLEAQTKIAGEKLGL